VKVIVEKAVCKHKLIMITKTGERLHALPIAQVGTKAASIAKTMSKPLEVQMELQKLAIRRICKTHGPAL
jgi:hypothetical protein